MNDETQPSHIYSNKASANEASISPTLIKHQIQYSLPRSTLGNFANTKLEEKMSPTNQQLVKYGSELLIGLSTTRGSAKETTSKVPASPLVPLTTSYSPEPRQRNLYNEKAIHSANSAFDAD